MAGRSYDLTPKAVPKVNTPFRRIVTKFPVPQSLPVLRKLLKYEPRSMSGQPPVVWDRAEGVQVYDKWGNMWLDWSSGVLVTNCGHGRAEVRKAIIGQAEHGLLHNYCFPNEPRALLAERLVNLAPKPLDKAFILTTGAEATENAIKLARTYGVQVGGEKKIKIVSFARSFHGRTLGSQLAGGIPSLKKWIVKIDPTFVQVEFPDGFRCEDTSFAYFQKQLSDKSAAPDEIAGVITESYQGGGASFAPVEFMKELRKWCDEHQVVLICDEVQSGFGRTGKLYAFEHYGIAPDLACLGKGVSSSLPLSAVLGKSKVMNLYGPGEMTSTHTGNPICSAAALANIDVILGDKLVDNSMRMGVVLHKGLDALTKKYSDVIGAHHGKGLVAGLHMVKPGSKEPDGDLAFEVINRAYKKGLLFFAPVGFGSATVKIGPPLVINEEAIKEGLGVLDVSIAESIEALAKA